MHADWEDELNGGVCGHGVGKEELGVFGCQCWVQWCGIWWARVMD